MSTPEFESFLARLYTDPEARARFLNNRIAEAQSANLTPDQIASLEHLDADALEAAAHSFTRKRQHKLQHAKRRWFPFRLK
ncbi:MAG: hypothetical protein JST93_03955 [Acidobacteria bacterium]|nr:hypothetical protein [Acidobacteriota bacterium]